ncbi:eukaryotic translation initiation factor 2-alpha kinase 3 isoform X1 [Hydra vulgaris]|nr:eukaryotic translation initiation factor 2-alpha kinase 3 [Hydra vulgaris]
MLLFSCLASLLFNVASELIPGRISYEVPVTNTETLEKQSEIDCPDEVRSYLLISTIDGKVSCLNTHDGTVKWISHSTQSLLSSSVKFKGMNGGSDIRIVPSLDGKLYTWDGEKLEKVPFTAEYLLGHLQKLSDGSFVVGSKESMLSGIDINSGEIAFECSAIGCQLKNQNQKVQNKDILSLRRIQQTIRVVNPQNGLEKWNFSVGTYEMDFYDGFSHEIPSHSEQSCASGFSENLFFDVQSGTVSSNGHANWSFEFGSPIAKAWILDDGRLNELDVLKDGLIRSMEQEAMPDTWVYMGLHDGQIYVQHPKNLPPTSLQVTSQPYVKHWRPFISSSYSRTPALNNNKQLGIRNSLDYPFDNGFILILNRTPTEISLTDSSGHNENQCFSNANICEKNKPSVTVEATAIVPLSVKDYWKEMLFFSLVIAIGINIVMRVVKKKFENSSPLKNIVIENNSTPTAPDPQPHGNSDFSSRYITDFQHLECLGKGGFGVVFKAKKKIDDCEYAIKRIYLPRCEEAQEKMTREVKALAALDHPGIVRYFHAWWETPPPGWQHATDQKLLLLNETDVTNSFALSNDWIVEIMNEEKNLLDNDAAERIIKSSRKNDCLLNDPLNKNCKFDQGTELSSDELDCSGISENKVFSTDNSSASSCVDEDEDDPNNTEDSFDIVFESEKSDAEENNRHRHVTLTQEECDNVIDTTCKETFVNIHHTKLIKSSSSKDPSGDERSVRSKEKDKKKVVGKCCSKFSKCLTEPPLFLYIQMQLCRQATLKDWLSEKSGAITLSQAFDIFMQIVDAVEYFHRLGLMHRDLKPANIFFSLDGSVKVGDFGLVTAITRPSDGIHKGKFYADENHTGQVGTQLYMSPEQVCGRPYNHKVDIHSLGLIFFELLCSFSTQMERIQTIYQLKKNILPPALQCTSQGKLVQLLTASDQEQRPEAREIKCHQYTKDIEKIVNSVKCNTV